MPKEGFKSITIPESVYDNFQTMFEKVKEEIKMQGVFSFSAFVTLNLNKILTKDGRMKLLVIINGVTETIDLDSRFRQMEYNKWKECPLMTQHGEIRSVDLRLEKK